MKYSAIILSAIIVLLSWLPNSELIHAVKYTVVYGISPAENPGQPIKPRIRPHDHTGDNDDHQCSPFCPCDCCGSVFTWGVTPQLLQVPHFLSPRIAPFQNRFTSDYLDEIWQPPRFC
jgi:hypothetical protein